MVAETAPAKLIPWYEKQGYWFTQADEPAYVRYWGNRSLGGLYGDTTPTQRIGFKALVPGVTVEHADGRTFSGNYAVRGGARRVQALVQVSGLLG